MQLPDLTQEEHGRKGEAVVSLAPFSELPGLAGGMVGALPQGGKAGEGTKEKVCGSERPQGGGEGRVSSHKKEKRIQDSGKNAGTAAAGGEQECRIPPASGTAMQELPQAGWARGQESPECWGAENFPFLPSVPR